MSVPSESYLFKSFGEIFKFIKYCRGSFKKEKYSLCSLNDQKLFRTAQNPFFVGSQAKTSTTATI